MNNETAYILLGSNLGERHKYLANAVSEMALVDGLVISAESTVYESAPFGMNDLQPPFLNQVARISYAHSPMALLGALEKIERKLGRDNKGKLMPRTIDLDILFFGKHTINTERLVIPHQKVLEREFAILPLLEIDPDFIVPGKNKRLDCYIKTVSDKTLRRYNEHVTR